MFKILLSLLIIFPVLMGFGEIFQKLFGRIWSGLSAKLFSGMFLLAIIWQVLAFFVPLNIWIESYPFRPSRGVGGKIFFSWGL